MLNFKVAVATAIHMKIEPCKFNAQFLQFVDEFVLKATMLATGDLGPEDETNIAEMAEKFTEIQEPPASFAEASPRKVIRRRTSEHST